MRCEIEAADGVLFGSSSINGDALPPVWDIINVMFSVNVKGKKCASFGSYGWSWRGYEAYRTTGSKDSSLTSFNHPKINLIPTEEALRKCAIFGYDFVQIVD